MYEIIVEMFGAWIHEIYNCSGGHPAVDYYAFIIFFLQMYGCRKEAFRYLVIFPQFLPCP